MATDLSTTIATNLQRRMDYLELSTDQVAKLADLDPSEINKILSGSEVSTEILLKIADELLMYVSHLTGELPLEPFKRPEENLKAAGFANEYAIEAIKTVVRSKSTMRLQTTQQAVHNKLNKKPPVIPEHVQKKIERYVPVDVLESLAIQYRVIGKKVEALLFDRKKKT